MYCRQCEGGLVTCIVTSSTAVFTSFSFFSYGFVCSKNGVERDSIGLR